MTSTLEALKAAWQAEQETNDLQKLPDGLLVQVKDLVKATAAAAAASGTSRLQAIVTRQELKMVEYLWNDLLKQRKHKIQAALEALGEINESYLLGFEVDLYQILKGAATHYEAAKRVVPEIERKLSDGSEYVLIRVLEDQDAIMGADLRTYGPFKKEDLVYMPRDNADILVSNKKAQKLGLA
jgi:DNA replication initiation complex subunit (GINS family)